MEHATCHWPGCTTLLTGGALKWCTEHREAKEDARRRKWNTRAGALYRSRPKPMKKSADLPHSAVVALFLGRDPFR